ncbi:hypothetical protein CEQ90_05385 [Lewinellaceae bacterium SD302]|nr:hypothetical protein CEQ90_05385 [Lewinellaceae bacterium SD302]
MRINEPEFNKKPSLTFSENYKIQMVRFYLLAGLVAVLSVLQLNAQEARFAQFYANPMYTNPAMTGVMEGQLRFTANYRELYTSILGNDGFRTISAGLEIRRPVGRGNFFGFGAQFLRDQAAGNFTRNTGVLSGSFQKKLAGGRRGPTYFLSGGAQLGFGQRGFDVNKLWFSNQFFVDDINRTAFIDRGLSSGEAFGAANSGLYIDFNAGLLWYGVMQNGTSFYVGGSAYHLNEPNISFIGLDDPLARRFVGHAGAELPLGSSGFSILPATMVQIQGPATSATAGANFRYSQKDWKEVALRAGLWAHVSNRLDALAMDAMIFTAVLELERVQFGVSYDITVNDLKLSNNGRGAFELSMIYVQKANYRSKVECPTF